MSTGRLTRSTFHLAVLSLLAALSTPAVHAASPVRLQLTREHLVLVPVTADDEGPFYFVLDTGSDVTVVDTALARKLALDTLQSAHMTTITGTDTVGVSRLAKLAVGGMQVDQLPVFEEDLSSLRSTDSRIAGIIGQDFLSHYNYLLDYRARSIRFEEGDDIRDGIDGEAVPVQTDEKLMVLPAEAQFRGHAGLRLILDSGANTVVLMGAVSDPLLCSEERQETQISASGAAPVRLGQLDLTVASHKFLDVFVTFSIGAPPQPNDDGLLPMSLFDAIYVNNHQSFVVLNPRVVPPLKQSIAASSQKTIRTDR